jgi:hypothetical protein
VRNVDPIATNRWRGPCVASLVITTAAIVVTWPQAAFLTSRYAGQTDALFSVWRLAWIADSLGSNEHRLYDAPIFYPHRNTLAYSDSILLSGLVTAPLRLFGVGPFAVYNGYLAVAIIGSGMAAALLCRRLSGSWSAAALGGIVFTLNPHRMEHFERLELLTSFGIPLAFYCWHRGTGENSQRWIAFTFVCAAAQWYLGMYHGLFLVCALACLAIDLPHVHASARRSAYRGIAVGGLIAALAVAPSAVPYLAAREDVGERGAPEAIQYSAEIDDYLAVHDRNWMYGDALAHLGAPERHFFPGLVASLLALAGLVLAPRRTALLYAAVLVVAFDLSRGMHGVLLPILRETAMPFRGIRSPARAAVIVMLPVAVFASVAAGRLFAALSTASRRTCLVALALLMTVEYKMQVELWNVPEQPPISMTALPADAVVLELPVARPDRLDLNLDPHYMVGRIGEWPRMLNGYSGHYPDDYIVLLEQMVDFPSASSLAFAARRGATHIVIHEAWLEGGYKRLIEAVLRRDELELVGRYMEDGGEVSVFRFATQLSGV